MELPHVRFGIDPRFPIVTASVNLLRQAGQIRVRLAVLFFSPTSVPPLHFNASRTSDRATNSIWSAGLISPVGRFVAFIFLTLAW
jgi:hypothetical protein